MDIHSPYYSHAIRWSNTARSRRFLAGGNSGSDTSSYLPESLEIPSAFSTWPELCQAQYWEIVTFLSPYLLSSQGDRMSMAHSVEGRYPFLDYRVVEFCNKLPIHLKLLGLNEKFLLKELAKKYVPPEIWQRVKRPYRAPVQRSFFHLQQPEYVNELLSEEALSKSGYFESKTVHRLAQKAASEIELSEVEDMALVGVLSTQLLDHMFLRGQSQAQKQTAPHLKLVVI